MTTPADVFRRCRAAILQPYLAERGLRIPPDFRWTRAAGALAAELDRLLQAADQEVRDVIEMDADRIGVLVDESGEEALYGSFEDKSQLDACHSAHERALHVLRSDPAAFARAEQARFADEKRNGRDWVSYEVPPALSVLRTAEALRDMEQAIAETMGTPNARVQICNRAASRKHSVTLVQATVFIEGRMSGELAFVGSDVKHLSRRRVIEAAITYDAASGIMEVIYRNQVGREVLARLFADHLLQQSFGGKRIPLRRYNLEILRRPCAFPTAPEHAIETVHLTLMRLRSQSTGAEHITLECLHDASPTIWGMARTHLKQSTDEIIGYDVARARLRIRFARRPGRRRRTLTISLRPNGTDLKDRTADERLIGETYLSRWNLIANA